MSDNAVILGLDPAKCDGIYPRTRDGRCQGCGVVGEHPRSSADPVDLDEDDERDAAVSGPCSHCQTPCTGDDYCYGCETFVCAACSPYYDGPGGKDHGPADHLLCLPALTALADVEDGATNRAAVGTCRYRVGGGFCGARAVFSAYCLEHLHAVIDERVRAGKVTDGS